MNSLPPSISSQGNGTEYQLFKMGLFVENQADVSRFLTEAEKLCLVRVIDCNRSEKVFGARGCMKEYDASTKKRKSSGISLQPVL